MGALLIPFRIAFSISSIIGLFFFGGSIYDFYQFLQLRGGPKLYLAEELERGEPNTKNVILKEFVVMPRSVYKSTVRINHGDEHLSYYEYGIVSKERALLRDTSSVKIFLRSKVEPSTMIHRLADKDSFSGYYEKGDYFKYVDETALENKDIGKIIRQFAFGILLLGWPIVVYFLIRLAR